MSSLYTVIADYLSLGISRETIRRVKLEIAAGEIFPAFPLNGSEDAMLTAVKLKIDQLERIFHRHSHDGVWSEQDEQAFLCGVEAICIGFAIFDKKQAEVMQLATLKKVSKRRERMVRPRERVCLEQGLKLDLVRLARRGFIQFGANVGPRDIQWKKRLSGEVIASGVITADMSGSDFGWLQINMEDFQQCSSL
jgi:hypothetical protein